MPLQLSCPSCGATLRVGEDLLGRKVRCPKCSTTFTAEAPEPPEPPEPPAEGGAIQKVAPSSRRPPKPADEEEPPTEEELPSEEEPSDEDAPRRRKRRRSNTDDESGGRDVRREKRAHHGPIVMGLGIASLVVSLLAYAGICCCGGIGMMIFGTLGLGLGLPAWVMGQRDLAAMRGGEMSWEGESTTKAGWICGIIGTIAGGLALLIGCGLLGLAVAFNVGGGGVNR